MRSNDDARHAFRNIFYVASFKLRLGFQAASSRFRSPPVPSSLLHDPKFQAAGFGAQAFSHRFHAAGSVGSAGQAPNSRFRVQSSRFYLFPQILSPQYSDSRPEPQPRPQPHVPRLRLQAQPPTSPGPTLQESSSTIPKCQLQTKGSSFKTQTPSSRPEVSNPRPQSVNQQDSQSTKQL